MRSFSLLAVSAAAEQVLYNSHYHHHHRHEAEDGEQFLHKRGPASNLEDEMRGAIGAAEQDLRTTGEDFEPVQKMAESEREEGKCQRVNSYL